MSDLISREDVVKAVDDHTVETYDGLLLTDDITCILEEVPSAERVGEWVIRHPMRHDGKFLGYADNDIEDTRFSHLYCRECGRQMPIFEYFPYCPYCGAKMKLKDWMKGEQND